MYKNFKVPHPILALKKKIWEYVRETIEAQFNSVMISLRSMNDETYKCVEKVLPKHQTRSCQSGTAKCEMLLNNLYESFNATVISVRNKPIITILEKIRMHIKSNNVRSEGITLSLKL